MTNYVSFSLYGESPIYITGAIENVVLCRTVYPDWTPIIYIDDEVPSQVRRELEANGGLVVQAGPLLSKNKMSWRFAAALIEDAELVLFRDADSRINSREQACVEAWMASGRALHIMRDHPFHSSWIMAGMWGIDAKAGSSFISKVLAKATGRRMYGEDQDLLASELYRHLRHKALVHDSFFMRENGSRPFPSQRQGGEFVGERIDAEGKPEKNMRESLVRYEKSKFLRLKLRVRDYFRTRYEQKLW
jgi:hypothetical protein